MVSSIVKKVVAGAVIFVVFVIAVLYLTDTGEWSLWTLEGEWPTCGSGIKKYVRKCTMGSIAKILGKKCLGESTATEVYDLSPCPFKGRYIFIERVAKSLLSGETYEDPTEEAANSLSIAEVNVLGVDDKTLIDSNTIATAGSIFDSAYPASNLIDSNRETTAHSDAPRTITDFSTLWFKIDLGSDKVIKSVEIVNNPRRRHYKINGLRLRIQNSAGVDVFTGPEIRETGPSIPRVVYDKWQ